MNRNRAETAPAPLPKPKRAVARNNGGDVVESTFVPVHFLQGDCVAGVMGNPLGRIHEIVVDVHGGRIAYAVVSTRGTWGLGERLWAVPWEALTLDAEHHRFVLDEKAAEACWD